MIGQSSGDNLWITSDEAYHSLALRLTMSLGVRGIRVDYLPEVDSTNAWIKTACAEKPPLCPVVVFTRQQTAGRGTRGREWLQSAGRDIALSCGVAFAADKPVDMRLSLAVGGCLAGVIEGFTGCPVRLKWPNDLLLRSAGPAGTVNWLKFAGILLETSALAGGQRLLVVGVGVNANSNPSDLPEALHARVTSLSAELGRPVDVCALTERLLDALVAVLPAGGGTEIAGWLAEWFRRDATAGSRYLLKRDGDSIPAVAVGVERDTCALVVADAAGQEYTVDSYTELENPPR